MTQEISSSVQGYTPRYSFSCSLLWIVLSLLCVVQVSLNKFLFFDPFPACSLAFPLTVGHGWNVKWVFPHTPFTVQLQ